MRALGVGAAGEDFPRKQSAVTVPGKGQQPDGIAAGADLKAAGYFNVDYQSFHPLTTSHFWSLTL